MPRHQETRSLPYAPDAMFAIVADVARYPEFLPWCVGARVRASRPEGARRIEAADLMIAFKGFREQYTSEVTLDPEARTIAAIQTAGPFKHLTNEWRFIPRADGGTDVAFAIDFEFRNPVLRMLVNRLFGEAVTRMVRAFETRAATLAEQT